MDLGLSFKELESELETGALAMKPASQESFEDAPHLERF